MILLYQIWENYQPQNDKDEDYCFNKCIIVDVFPSITSNKLSACELGLLPFCPSVLVPSFLISWLKCLFDRYAVKEVISPTHCICTEIWTQWSQHSQMQKLLAILWKYIQYFMPEIVHLLKWIYLNSDSRKEHFYFHFKIKRAGALFCSASCTSDILRQHHIRQCVQLLFVAVRYIVTGCVWVLQVYGFDWSARKTLT